MGTQLLEDTYPVTEPQAISGEQLVANLTSVNGLIYRKRVIFDASTEESMNDAIRVLLAGGYVPKEVQMVEGEFYYVRFAPDYSVYPVMDHWPYWVSLRFTTEGIDHLPLALARRSSGLYLWYQGSYPVTYGTSTSDAQKMRFHFKREHPRITPVWVPIFDRTPLLLQKPTS
jgi:hypothetical protein